MFWQLGFDLPRQQWSLLNRFRTEQGHCGACRRKWQLTDSDLCPCGETLTMFHIVESCPLTKLNGGLSRLHSADEDGVSWLTSYGSWHAYEKKKTDRLTNDRASPILPINSWQLHNDSIDTLTVMMVAMMIIIWCWYYGRFESFVPRHEDDYVCYEVTTILSVSSFQYIIMAVIFSKGLPYRKPIFSNRK